MKMFLKTVLAAGLALIAMNSQADEALAKSKGCLGCHGIDKKIVGPSYKDVAAKYAGQNVTDALAEKVIKGGGGVWGQMPMPPNAVSPDEAKKLVTWILGLK
ncbi:MAG: c-type cytochrome [Methylococcus sp.]